jgi:membrane-bound serine protease (ClpP class)
MTHPGGVRSIDLLRFLLVLLAASWAIALWKPADAQVERAVVLDLHGAIGPASADYFERTLAEANGSGAKIVVLRLDTPGGLDTSMREIIRAIIASPAPVAAYVAPGGARAASAGTYTLYASHLAVMAPGTNLGAATPVQIGGLPGIAPDETPRTAPEDADAADPKPQAQPAATKMEAKAINDAVAYIRALADLRGRNAEWAERAVREAASLDARVVSVGGAPVTLRTKGLAVEHLTPDWRHAVLAAITNPNVALILMMIGVYGLMFEFMNPGALYPGTIGIISLIVGLYALAVLPVNYAGMALVLFGIALMTAEAFAPSFGVLGIGGGAAFLLGGMILIDTEAPGFEVSIPLIAGLALSTLAFSLLVVRLALSSRRRRVVSGREEMIGGVGVVQDWSAGSGHVFAHSERWRAISPAPLRPGDRVRTVAVENLTLTVEPESNGDHAAK